MPLLPEIFGPPDATEWPLEAMRAEVRGGPPG
jgi:hypothetical protein